MKAAPLTRRELLLKSGGRGLVDLALYALLRRSPLGVGPAREEASKADSVGRNWSVL